jgi:serine/threonine-protein kinase
MIRLEIDGLGCELKSFHDLSWLKGLGRVFVVFDGLISGNLCFGIQVADRCMFLKYAGAPTLQYAGSPVAAVEKLKAAASRYTALRHPSLSPMIGQFDTMAGFGLLFPWFPGFALAPLEMHMSNFRKLPLQDRLRMFDSLASFFVHVSESDYTLAGVTDRQILVDFESLNILFSSVDHFMEMPAHTPFTKMAGSPWYIPPEGYVPGSTLDEGSNAYALGALAFTFFGDRKRRNKAGWETDPTLFTIAKRAIHDKREDRPAYAREFLNGWRGAVLRMEKL